MFLIPSFDVRYGFFLKTMFGSTLPLVVCRKARVLFRMFGSTLPLAVCRKARVLFTLSIFLLAHHGVQHILGCVCFCLLVVFCVSNIASFSGLSIFDCPTCII